MRSDRSFRFEPQLSKIYLQIRKEGLDVWMAGMLPEDADTGNLAVEGRVMEMMSENTVDGWLKGDILSGRIVLLNSYGTYH
ncbi:hypothetical protein QFC21_005634 [Naganishia friedmannii]|uniref:Uncharacterized protein n=1 Tax=Naganishia friedmannii TaxID=89922 RepID=A0ACC2V888_9TREE|nr:hypothetical protein QFC21_005634 [Naganishia friedmannii]